MAFLSYDVLSVPLLAYVIGNFIYSTQFHPLHEFPGPVSAACSRIPYWIAALKGDSCPWLVKLHARYGPVVRFGPNDLSYADNGQAWKDICGPETKGRKENGQSAVFFGPPKGPVHSMITANRSDHARVRRVLAPAFSERALRQQEPLFNKYADILVAALREEAAANGEKGVNLVQMFNFCTFDIMSDLTFGEPLGLLEQRQYTHWVELIFKSITIMPVVQVTEYYPLLRSILRLLEPRWIRDTRVAHFKHSTDRVDARIARGDRPGQPDIWSLVLAAGGKQQGDRGMSLDEMHANAEVFMTAGTETSATLLSGLCYYLMVNPDKMEKITGEIRGAFAKDDDMSLEALVALPYLNACIEEALRVYPPLPDLIPRIIPEGGNVILDKWIAPGTYVAVHHTASYRSPANFKNPNTFAPERWLGDPEYKDDQREAFHPFQYGPRNCLGQNMAYHEMRLLAAKVLFNFDLELCAESRNWTEQKVFILWDKKPLMCKLRAVTK
ncbi:hypothetical protein PG997_002229 [Apiospora hydei]|uniref:Cytochrome P450 n=1 Tax=Apiospora hydei TaxID=1337664 RepID=A0ABR1X8X3_9PEZI